MPSDTVRQSSINVAVRVRPFTSTERNKLIRPQSTTVFAEGLLLASEDQNSSKTTAPNGIRKIVNVVDDRMLIFDPPDTNPLNAMHKSAFPNGNSRIRDYKFVFDRLFDEDASQNDVYENTTRPLLDSILDGFNSTVFAYGATGCGKTHTILGTLDDPGVIFLTMKELYQRIELLKDTRIIDVSILFLEIYNETIRDLLSPETPHKKLILREDAKNRITVANLLSQKPLCVEEVMELIMVGNQNRTSSPTEANAASSRSHAVLQINVVLRDRTASLNEEHNFATLSIIDLAGSERAAATKNRGARLNEGANINKSLLALGNCINALCDPRRKNHVPYRNLKLTRLLKFSLGGNCKTVMIVCVSPLSLHYDETLNTLKYADRAKEIKTKLIRNRTNMDRHVGSYLKMITEQKQEIEELRSRESKVVEAAIERQVATSLKCIDAITNSIQSLHAAIGKQSHEKWRKYFLLAKRRLLLIQHNHLNVFMLQFNATANQNQFQSELMQLLLIQADYLRNKISEQIVNLERLYDTPSEIDQLFGRSMEFTLRKLQEMEGWSTEHTHIYQNLVEGIKDNLQKDVLVNSSILFDYLIGELDEFNYLPQGLSKLMIVFTKASGRRDWSGVAEEAKAAIEEVHQILEDMNNSNYDAAVEERTALFMQSKIDQDQRTGRVPNLSEFIPNLSAKPGDKRTSTSPLRSTRSFKKFLRRNENASAATMSPGDCDTSIDDSTILPKSDMDDDSPLSNRVIDKSLLDSLDINLSIDSPPMTQKLKNLDMNPKLRLLTDTKLSPSLNLLLKFPLLNKLASTKVVHNGMNQTSFGLSDDKLDIE